MSMFVTKYRIVTRGKNGHLRYRLIDTADFQAAINTYTGRGKGKYRWRGINFPRSEMARMDVTFEEVKASVKRKQNKETKSPVYSLRITAREADFLEQLIRSWKRGEFTKWPQLVDLVKHIGNIANTVSKKKR